MSIDDGLDKRLPELVTDALEREEVPCCRGAERVVDMTKIARPEPVGILRVVCPFWRVIGGGSSLWTERAERSGGVGKYEEGFVAGVRGKVEVED